MARPFLMICDGFPVADVMFDNMLHHHAQVFHSFEMLALSIFQPVRFFNDQSL